MLAHAVIVIMSIVIDQISCGGQFRNPSSSYQNQVSGPFKDDFFLSNLRIGGGRGSRFNGYFPRESYYNTRPKRPWFPYPEYATSNEIYSNKRPSSDEIPKSVEYGSNENGYGSKGSSEEYPASPEYGANEVFSDERKPTERPAQPDNSVENQVGDTRRSTKIIFSYDDNDEFGPHNWSKISKNCSGNSQSPVNLYTENSRYDDYSQPLLIEGFNSLASSIRIENSGHSALIRLSYPNGKPARIMGGPLKVPYILDNIHWHWGREDTSGSEHTVNARRYSAEAHFVTYNSNYESMAKASTAPKGLAVLAIFYELNNTANNPFIRLIPNVIEPESSYTETENVFSIRDLIETKNFPYLSYKGSLTTPNCLETVTWIVSTRPIKISSVELAELRKLKDEKGNLLTRNFRPLQQLNYRRVTAF